MTCTIESEWFLDLDDNYVLIVNNEIVATVHRPGQFDPWGIKIRRDGVTFIVETEFHWELADAQARAGAILQGAPCYNLQPLKMEY